METRSGGTGDAVRLGERGLRSTAPRRATLEALNRGGHRSAAEIFALVARDLPGTSLQAIYNVLAAFTEAGIVRKIELSGNAALYEARVGDNHHHLLCVNCGRIEDVPCVQGAAPCLAPSEGHGFEILSADITFTGLCPDCGT
ncbi:MAG: Fur family transcriptional regulator [Propioniciclava sp.]